MSHPFIPAPNTASCELIYNIAGQVVENRIHVQRGAPYTLAQLQSVRTVVINWFNAGGKAAMNTNASLVRVRTRALDTDTSPMEDYNLPAAIAGTVSGVIMPLNCAYAVKLGTTTAGRSARGRWYWTAISAGQLSDAGHVTSGYRDYVVGQLNTLIANLASNGDTVVIKSERHNKVWLTTAHNYYPVTAVAVDLNLDSQRRRLVGRGRT